MTTEILATVILIWIGLNLASWLAMILFEGLREESRSMIGWLSPEAREAMRESLGFRLRLVWAVSLRITVYTVVILVFTLPIAEAVGRFFGGGR